MDNNAQDRRGGNGLPVSSSESPRFDPLQERLFREVLKAMNDAVIPYVVSGTFALHEHTGIWRKTKDLDLFVTKSDQVRALEHLSTMGFTCEVKDRVWLAKAWRDGFFVDLITGMSNGVIDVDDSWIRSGVPSHVFDVPVKVLRAEELIVSKIFVTRRERFDGSDVAHLILACRDSMDWDRVFKLVGEHWEMLLWSLIFFRYIYPAHATDVPGWVWHKLLARFEGDLMNPKLDRPFRGTLIDENMFAIDVKEWGLENVIERYRGQHRATRGSEPENERKAV